MSRCISLFLVLVTASSLSAQASAVAHQMTAPPPEARYEILQSTLGAKFTFRVDRFTGETSQLVLQEDTTATWEVIPKYPHPLADTKVTGRANYQVFSSGLGVRFTFLLNVNTGATWQLTQDAVVGMGWSPLYTKPKKP